MSNQHKVRCHSLQPLDLLLDDMIARIALLSSDAIRQRRQFSFVVAGGTTPAEFYRRLINLDSDWDCWRIYFSDERCLPRNHPDRNDTMVRSNWLDAIAIDDNQIFSIPAQLGALHGAQQYQHTMMNLADFDLVLLGLGEDGHTASLFPAMELGETDGCADVLAIQCAPKPPRMRISMSANRLSRSHHVWVLVTGESKRTAVEQWQTGIDLPIAHIKPVNGIDLFTDLSLSCL